jgi:cytochrome b subunit of formate dehydrogenase
MWLPRSLTERLKKRKAAPKEESKKYIQRFSRKQRITHVFVIVSFIILALTGMMLKFAHMDWAKFLARVMGGVHNAGVLHRIGAVITFGYFGFHLTNLIREKRRKAPVHDEIYLWQRFALVQQAGHQRLRRHHEVVRGQGPPTPIWQMDLLGEI